MYFWNDGDMSQSKIQNSERKNKNVHKNDMQVW